MKTTLIYTALLLLLVLSVNARIIDNCVFEPYPPQCKSALRIRILGKGQDIYESEARRLCETSCADGTRGFKDYRCPKLCGLERKSPSNCNLCSNGVNVEVRRCRDAVDSLVRRCKRGCRENAADKSYGKVTVRSTSGGTYIPFPSKITY